MMMSDFEKSNRRGKYQRDRELYTPGSGPLRKSFGPRDGPVMNSESVHRNGLTKPRILSRDEEVEKITKELKKITLSANKDAELRSEDVSGKRQRKPGSEIYVPKPAQRLHDQIDVFELKRAEKQSSNENFEKVLYSTDRNGFKSVERSGKKKDKKKRSKGKHADSEKTELSKSRDSMNNPTDNYTANRFTRHGSEPPMNQEMNVHSRDIRSVEPGGSTNWNHDRMHNKPPVGYQNKRNNPKNLPPRFQKKFMAENGLLEPSEEKFNQTPSETGEKADLVDRDSPESLRSNCNMERFKRPQSLSEEWSKSLPKTRGRGRGALKKDVYESLTANRIIQTPSLESDRSSSLTFSNKNYDYVESLPYNVEEKENQEQGYSYDGSNLENESQFCDAKATSDLENFKTQTNVLDWAAEVEMSLSKGNSKESLTVVPSVPVTKGRRKKKRRQSWKESKERSVSRERPRQRDHVQRGSVENLFNHSRNNSIERNWRDKSHSTHSTWQSSNFGRRSRHNTPERNTRRQGSRRNSFCDNSRQNSSERYHGGRRGGSRKNSSCDNRSRPNSLERHSRRTGGKELYCDNRSRQNSPERKDHRNRNRNGKRQTEDAHRRLDLPNKDEGKQAGIIVLPQPFASVPKYNPPVVQRKLFDPCNPDKPIVVSSSRVQDQDSPFLNSNKTIDFSNMLIPANDAMMTQAPPWYNPYKENFQQSHNPHVIREIAHADCELQYLLGTGEAILHYWDQLQRLRFYLKDQLKIMLLTDLRFCQAENVEQHLWKILYYNIIELLRKFITENPQMKEKYKMALITIIDEGSEFYERLLEDLENANKINLDKYLNAPSFVREGLGHIGLVLIAAQKIYLCLGDLARYKEQANDATNYGAARQWYMKAHQINPKNGRPYNQLAILAMYTKRRLDAVYYYMRCLMSSNPMVTAKDSLNLLFDDNRKKYEAVDRKRKEDRARKEREKMKEKEGGGGYRKEIWIHPGGGKNVHRTTSTCQPDIDSADEELYAATNIEVNKRFCMSYLHVHGKIFTKIGLESLSETIQQMLREFRALLQHSPIPLNSTRFLQLFALNMFAIEITQPKGDIAGNGTDGCYRSALQESALVASLQMFNLILERFIKILQDHLANPNNAHTIPSDCQVILPALKIWCDWLTSHFEIWNPPPSCQDYKVGPPGDCWSRLAVLVNLLEKLEFPKDLLSEEKKEDSEVVFLPEDATLAGFNPLIANSQEPVYVHEDVDMDLAQNCLRIQKILFFGSVFLCGLDPPVLKVQKMDSGESEYVSVVDTPGSQEQSDLEVCESMSSSEESDDSGKATGVEEDETLTDALKNLIFRKDQLERQHRRQQARHKNIQKVISISEVMTVMEVRPHDLVPDTNCFIDCLPQIEALLKILPNPQHPYVIMVPLIVMNELEGLSRGCKPSQSALHSVMVRETARDAMALFQKKHPALRCVTTKGSVLISPAFTVEEDTAVDMKNDDKILATCINISKAHTRDEVTEGGKKKLYREVVLLTDDKSLRLKAISRDMPVRSLADFMKWAGLG
ncbi:telomerase-binding protein EST1A isoform X2 [Cimex lectularius]|uniref:PIN domain-containing protein n=1 Tax=Cimex lectularius TaxID=79782 RepID=A0A8I6SHE9_CIMLE|nr:telomerase-binding protein EST1A isoform X2 [Cimex lectularius]